MKKISVYIDLIIWIVGFVAVLVCASGCKSQKIETEHHTRKTENTTDSVGIVSIQNTRPLTVPQSTANISLDFLDLSALPIGAKYTQKQGQATLTIEKTGDNQLSITANCDSLLFLITEKETTIFHLQQRISEFEETKTKTDTEIIKEPSPLQWFFVYSGYLFWFCLAACALWFFKFKK